MLIFDPKDLLLGQTKVHMSPHEAQAAVIHVAELHQIAPPVLVFEAALPDKVLACCVKPESGDNCTIQFEDRGCPLELLAHEMAHAIEFANGDERNLHDDAFGILVCLVGWQIMDWIVSTWPFAPPVPLIATYLNRARDPMGMLRNALPY